MDIVWQNVVASLKDRGLVFEPGLSDAEAKKVESEFGFRFPPDLREFLRAGLPVGDKFPNWRSEQPESLRERLAIPITGLLFDVEFNGFWLSEWGPTPQTLAEAQTIVRKLVASAPILIPVYAHRMIPDRPNVAGNPVFSVHQTDIIYYGANLHDYLVHEFLTATDRFGHCNWTISKNVRPIEFWDIDRFQSVRWSPMGTAVFDNRKGILP